MKIPYFEKGNVIYLDYPNYEGNLANGYTGPGKGIVNKIMGQAKARVGHNSFILVPPNGNTEYYEYGRFNTGNIIGKKLQDKGNWVKAAVPNWKQGDCLQSYMDRNRGKLPHSNQGTIKASLIENAELQDIRNYITTQANNPERSSYGISNTCATQASEAVNKGVGSWGNPFKAIGNFISNVWDNPWTLLPGSSQSTGAGMRAKGTSYTIAPK